jgi:hypothetical protein
LRAKAVWGAVLVVVLGAISAAQVIIPTEYRLTRTTVAPQGWPGIAPVVMTFMKSAMSCNITPAAPVPGSLRIDDPERLTTHDCEFRDTAGTSIVRPSPGYEHRWTLAARVNADPWTSETPEVIIRTPAIPPVPSGFGAAVPPVQMAQGVVRERFQLGSVDIAGGPLDLIGIRFLFGVDGVPLPVAQGQHFAIAVW